VRPWASARGVSPVTVPGGIGPTAPVSEPPWPGSIAT
jgi:hypothetical protein